MADRSVDFLIVGGGLAAAYCASELRKQGAEGSILLAGREPEPPYERPPLSKEYLRGEATREDAYVNPVEWYEENAVELRIAHERDGARPGGADGEAPGRGGGRRSSKALIATGRERQHPAARGGASSRASTTCARSATRTRSASRRATAERVVLIGGSYIGCEVAASLTAPRGPRCTMRDARGGGALADASATRSGAGSSDVLSRHGIEIFGGEELEAFEGDGDVSAVVDQERARRSRATWSWSAPGCART